MPKGQSGSNLGLKKKNPRIMEVERVHSRQHAWGASEEYDFMSAGFMPAQENYNLTQRKQLLYW